jgi:hypothetical protein
VQAIYLVIYLVGTLSRVHVVVATHPDVDVDVRDDGTKVM